MSIASPVVPDSLGRITIRIPRSTPPANAKLTGLLAYWLRTEHPKTPARTLAAHLKCSPSAVCQARRGATYKWAGGLR